MKQDYTDDWKLYLTGRDYNNQLNPPYYRTINTNINMYTGDQWNGVKSNGLPTPVFNIFKRIINHKIASITSQDTAIQMVSEEADDNKQFGDMTISGLTEIMTAYFAKLWEKSKMSSKVRELLLDGALTGDYCIYSKWDAEAKTGQYSGTDEFGIPVEILGGIDNEIIDSVNVFFGNPNDRRVNENGKPIQPYIIVAFRELTSKLKEEAKAGGAKKEDYEAIDGDTDTEYQAGDRGQIELENSDEGKKTTCIIKLWPNKGTIYARKSTKHCIIPKKINGSSKNEYDTKRTIYPLAWGNWDLIKNSYHGQAEGTGLVPNQIFINKLFAMAMISVMNTAFPRIAFDKTRIAAISNQVGATYGIDGDITNAIKVIEGANMSSQVMSLIDNTIAYTKDMLGASDAAMGDVKPDNTSAIIAVQQAAAVPLETIKQCMYQFIEDLGYIWLDSMIAYYGEREIVVDVMGEKVSKLIDFSQLRDLQLSLKVDVGASSYWSKITSVQTLDNLLQQDRITFLQYLDRLPDGYINKRSELISELKQAQLQQPPSIEEIAAFIESLPIEQQQELMAMDDETRYNTAVQMMQQPPQGGFLMQ